MSKRFVAGLALIFLWVNTSAFAFWVMFDGQFSYDHCLFRTFILVSTVNEPFSSDDLALLPSEERVVLVQQFSILVLAVGMGILLYTVSLLAAVIIESDIGSRVRRRRLQRMIDSLQNHTIVCGGGETGRILIRELERLGEPYCVVELDEDRCKSLKEAGLGPILNGDAASDDVLRAAAIDRARGVIAALRSDKDNLFVVVTARQLAPKVKIVSRCDDVRTHSKLHAAGADAVVLQNHIAAGRMVGAMVRPTVVEFVDQVIRDPKSPDKLDEVEVGPDSEFVGKSLNLCNIEYKHGLSVLGIRQPGEDLFRCNPEPAEAVQIGTALVVLGPADLMQTFSDAAGAPTRRISS